MNKLTTLILTALLLAQPAVLPAADAPTKKPNVLLIVCDDLNSYIEGFAVRVAVPAVVAMDVAPSASLAFFEEENARKAGGFIVKPNLENSRMEFSRPYLKRNK